MIIKNYTYDTQVDGSQTFILDGVQDVVVHHNMYTAASNGPRFEGPNMPTTWIEQGSPMDPEDLSYFVDYTDKQGVRCRLRVKSYAYICNDKGETVDKVGAKRVSPTPSDVDGYLLGTK